jgi:hypothetical protein
MIKNPPNPLKWVDFGFRFSEGEQKLVFVGTVEFRLLPQQGQQLTGIAAKGFVGKCTRLDIAAQFCQFDSEGCNVLKISPISFWFEIQRASAV